MTEPAELARLLVSVDHRGLGIALWHFAVAVRLAGKDLYMMWAVHRLHRILATLARSDLKKFVCKFIPMS